MGWSSGLSVYFRERAPGVRIAAVEPIGAASLTAALAAGGPVRLEYLDPFVDGAAVRRIGDLPYALLAGAGVEVSSVDPGAICTEMLALYQNEGIIAEPAGALSVAALADLDLRPGSTVVCLISGGNNDVSRYGEIVERSLVHAGLKHYFLVDFPQEPGALRRFLDDVLGPGRRHHAVRVRQAQQPGDRGCAGRHRTRIGGRIGRPAGPDGGGTDGLRADRAGIGGLPLSDVAS